MNLSDPEEKSECQGLLGGICHFLSTSAIVSLSNREAGIWGSPNFLKLSPAQSKPSVPPPPKCALWRVYQKRLVPPPAGSLERTTALDLLSLL